MTIGPAIRARVRLDGIDYLVRAEVGSVDELRMRLQSAMVRGDVDQLWLADGATMLVNWRTVATAQVFDLPDRA